MKFKAIKSGLLVAALGVAANAQAAIDLPGSDVENTGGSEIVLSVVTTSNDVYILDTGIGYADITTTSEFSIANDATLSGLLGSVAYWWVGAADSTQGGAGTDASTYGRGTQLTSTSGAPVVPSETVLGQQVLGIDAWVGLVNSLPTHDSVADGASLTNGGLGDLLSGGTGLSGSTSIVGNVGDTMAYYSYAETGTVQGGFFGNTFIVDGVSSELLGEWTLGQDALTFVGSEVPVPAAVWLFGSALLGMVGVSRRK